MTQKQPKKIKKSIVRNAVSLFSNCGAGDVGYKLAGFDFKVMAELDERRLEVCGLNHPDAHLVKGDLNTTWRDVVKTYKDNFGDELDLLCACPPCQGFSSARGDRGKSNNPDHGMRDTRNLLSLIIAEVAKELRPKLIVVENVPAFLGRLVRDPKTKTPITMAELLTTSLASSYKPYYLLIDLCEYGVPQTRKRVFFTFIRKDIKFLNILDEKKLIPFPKPTHSIGSKKRPITIGEAFKSFNLPVLDAKSLETAKSDYANGLHFVPVWDSKRYEMVAEIPKNNGSSAWQNLTCLNCGETDIVLSRANCPSCNRPLPRPVIKSRNGRYRLIKGFKTSSYRRMNLNLPAATITTASGHVGSHFTIHPNQNRVLSPLECAYLQTFPKEFKWGDALKKWGHSNIREMIGEAVPPKFTAMHGKVLYALLNGITSRNLLSESDSRHIEAKRKLELKINNSPLEVI
ncbi:MAG: DNA cytosine methyltransferase [Anaerolineales bacterium]|nr:DNA cytosine methyltransferase [Anaerolineales bacterium]